MSAASLPYEIPRPVAKKVSRLRRLVRLYSLAEGLAALVIVAGAAFWVGLGIDWLLEPRPAMRAAMWLVVAAAAAVAAWRYIGRRALAPLPNDSLALLVERRHPQLRDGLVTTVQAADERDFSSQSFGRQLIGVTSRRTAAAMDEIQLRRVFNFQPLARKGAAALALTASVAAFALVEREAFAFWVERMQLSEQLWPRRVELTVVGFDGRGDAPSINVARDDDFELTVLASIVDGHEAPDEVEIRWRRPSDGVRGGGPMLRIGQAVAGRDRAQQFQYTFKVASDLVFDVIGGDDRVRNLRLRAVERPAITRVWLECGYPAYLEREPRSILVGSRADVPEGARAICRIEANKPLKSAVVRDSLEQVDLPVDVAKDRPREISFSIDRATADRVFMITLHDADGVENRDPFRLVVAVVPDEAPEASVQLRGIGTAVTPQATIPVVGRLTDDYALREAWFEYQVDDAASERRPLAREVDDLPEVRLAEAFDLAEANPETNRPRVELKPGQKLALSLQARDGYDLGEPHVGSSQRFLLDVVTPSELRALLEKRELGLRQRFEAIHERMADVRQLLDRIDLDSAAAEADDNPPDDAPASSERGRRREIARVGGAHQTTTQQTFETMGVAEGFDDIVAELVNNRVDTEELKQRLEQGISEPLKEIGGEMLPELEQRLDALQAALESDVQSAEQPLTAAKSQADDVLTAMDAVLNRMLELESYNEIVELLRGIISDQEQLRERTQQQQKERLRGLLEE
jgi:hypothetical protein